MATTPTCPPGLVPGGRFAAWAGLPPRYLVADVDGTLVGPSGDVSSEVVAAAGQARAAGLRMGFATGRMHLAVAPLHAALTLPGPHVFHNGAEVRADGRSAARWPLDDDGLRAVYAVAAATDSYVELYVPDGYWISRHDERARPHWDLLGLPPSGVAPTPEALVGQDVIKATFAVFVPDHVAPLVAALDAAGLRAGPAGSPITPDIIYVNATAPTVSKGRALAAAADVAGVSLQATAAVGDAANDLPMLAVAGTAIAMGQAAAEVRAAAHLVAPGVDAHGVAVAIHALLSWRAGALA